MIVLTLLTKTSAPVSEELKSLIHLSLALFLNHTGILYYPFSFSAFLKSEITTFDN